MNRRLEPARSAIAALAAVLAIGAPLLSLFASGAEPKQPEWAPAVSAAQAKETALSILGFDRAKLKVPVEHKVIAADETPFLGQRIQGRDLWVVHCDHVLLWPGLSPEYRGSPWNRYVHKLDVVVDPDTGQVLKIESVRPFLVKLKPRPSKADAEQTMRGSSMCFHGFPPAEMKPKATFKDAVRNADGAFAFGCAAKQLVAYYVLYSQEGQMFALKYADPAAPSPIWWITHRGLNVPMSCGPAPGPGEPPRDPADCPVAHDMHVAVDPVTGEALFATTVP